MEVLVIGANGATGKHVVGQLLKNDPEVKVKALMRSQNSLRENWKTNSRVQIIEASINDMSVQELQAHVEGCKAVISTLGHNISLKGIYGKPRKLVRDTIIKVCEAIELGLDKEKVKVILMNTNGNRNRKTNEKIAGKERIVIGILRALLPPHVDNEQAADYLWKNEEHFNKVEWSAVRPDNLIDAEEVTEYVCHEAPIRSAIFNTGKTSRINVGDFMSLLALDQSLWENWKGKMPVIYNESSLV